jgi:hypothetical protein
MSNQARQQAVRWSITVSKETDRSVRTLLGAEAIKKGDMSRFVEDAVRWRVFHRTVEDIKARNIGMESGELQRIVDEAVTEVRAERRSGRKRSNP